MIGMSEMIIIAIVVAIVIAVMMISASRRAGGAFRVLDDVEIDPLATGDPEFQDYLERNRKIEAIKRYRELTGLGLKEAKDAVEYLMAYPDAPVKKRRAPDTTPEPAGLRDMVAEGKVEEAIDVYVKFAGVDYYTAKDAVEAIQRSLQGDDSGAAENLDARVSRLMADGRKIEAIKIYREATGLGLKEAKDAVEDIDRQIKR